MTPNPNIAKCKACGGDGDAKSGPAEGTLCSACGGSGYAWPTIDEAKKRATQLIENGLPDCRPSQPPFTNVDSLGRGDHNPPIGALGDAIASLRPKSVAKRIAAQKCEPYPFEAQPAGERPSLDVEATIRSHTAHLEARVAELEGALGNARGLLRRAVQSHMIRDLLGKFWVEDVSLWLNSKPVQSLDAARAKEKGNG